MDLPGFVHFRGRNVASKSACCLLVCRPVCRLCLRRIRQYVCLLVHRFGCDEIVASQADCFFCHLTCLCVYDTAPGLICICFTDWRYLFIFRLSGSSQPDHQPVGPHMASRLWRARRSSGLSTPGSPAGRRADLARTSRGGFPLDSHLDETLLLYRHRGENTRLRAPTPRD